ncbi:MAG: rhodanese-like domain-containing protein [Proteobacteria bacterium]|nr:rhodanese-like domain-containing protein [Pseudomonadota bacterium]
MERIPEFVANHLLLFSLLISILTLLMWNFYGDMLSGLKMLIPDEVTRLINREDARVVDVRSQKDFENGHIIDAINISADQLAGQLDKLKKFKDKGIIFCCASGSDSAKEARKLMNEGFEKVYCLKGGILSWQNANLPLTKGHK